APTGRGSSPRVLTGRRRCGTRRVVPRSSRSRGIPIRSFRRRSAPTGRGSSPRVMTGRRRGGTHSRWSERDCGGTPLAGTGGDGGPPGPAGYGSGRRRGGRAAGGFLRREPGPRLFIGGQDSHARRPPLVPTLPRGNAVRDALRPRGPAPPKGRGSRRGAS